MMTTKYHISPTTGRPNKCYATKRPCPIGGEGFHYATKEKARKAYESSQSSNTIAQPVKKDKININNLPEDAEERLKFIAENFDRFPQPAVDRSGNKIAQVSTEEELKREEQAISRELHGSTPEYLLKMRCNRSDVIEAESEGNYSVVAKEPSYSEINFSTDLARKYFGMEKRRQTNSDKTAARLTSLEVVKAEAKMDNDMHRGNQPGNNHDDYYKSQKRFHKILALAQFIHRIGREKSEGAAWQR